MNALESWLLSYLVNSLWQVPLLFLAAWIAARLARRHVALQHRIWVGALLLEVLLPACSLNPGATLHSLWQLALRGLGAPSAFGSTHVTVTTGAAYAHTMLHLPATLLTGIAIAYAACTIYFAARLIWRLSRTNTLRRAAQPIVPTGPLQTIWKQCSQAFELRNAQLASSSGIFSPITIGIRRKTILLPNGTLANLKIEDLTAAIAHEFAHMRRQDFAKNLLYRTLSLPIAWHPLLWLTQTRLTETREMVCDALAAEAACGRESYARSLLRLASALTRATPTPSLHAIGIFDACIFERRIMNLTEKQIEWKGARRLTAMAACALMAVGTCAFAMSLHMDVSASMLQTAGGKVAQQTPLHGGDSALPPVLIRSADPVYTEAARKAKLSGNVEISLRVDKKGNPSHIRVVRGMGMGLDQKAVEAVRQYKFKPATQNGKPVAVDLFVDVNFQIF